ncbi:hypothetical protein M407DRAFT_242929 [Tulasnella calospora MUT 4182]|uniref:Uncharacterized protein n=1 Tax=Tulasnella calospora MUT 4182 TaxID=1051891 RepID=A0A0C3QLY2_9AGAM|nr:hypothetical protein M407DRAFT_242929 [Tulasnella calospora MUT 4182]
MRFATDARSAGGRVKLRWVKSGSKFRGARCVSVATVKTNNGRLGSWLWLGSTMEGG